MYSFDTAPLDELIKLANNINPNNIGDAMTRAVALRSVILDSELRARSDEVLDKLRSFSRRADIGWKIFEKPIAPELHLTEMQIWQLLAIEGTLMEFNYSFERVEEASMFTFESSAPVRFYVNGIFHYLTTLFLLDTKNNEKKGFLRPGTLIKVLQPIGLDDLLDPVYQVFDRPFGEELTYGQTVLSIRNKQFVHGSFSSENIQKTVADSRIFDLKQKMKFLQCHWDVYDKLIILRLQLLSILSLANIRLDEFSLSRLYHF